MKIFIMTDLEGVAGVKDSINWCLAGGSNFPRARELLTMEVNAAIEGFIEAGADEILVADGHGGSAIDPDKLHEKAELACNWNESNIGSFNMEDRNFDFAAWVGQHPMAGTLDGHLSHTGNMGVIEQTINGIPVGEFGDLVLIASELGVRAIFASGCEAFCREARNFVPGINTVSVKKGSQTVPGHHLPGDAYREHNKSAVHLHPVTARSRIRAGAEKAARRAQSEDFGLVKLPQPPYKKIRIMRGDSEFPPRIMEQTHPESLLEMHRMPHKIYELKINPADPALRGLKGKILGTSVRP